MISCDAVPLCSVFPLFRSFNCILMVSLIVSSTGKILFKLFNHFWLTAIVAVGDYYDLYFVFVFLNN